MGVKRRLHLIADDLDGYKSWDEWDWNLFTAWVYIWS